MNLKVKLQKNAKNSAPNGFFYAALEMIRTGTERGLKILSSTNPLFSIKEAGPRALFIGSTPIAAAKNFNNLRSVHIPRSTSNSLTFHSTTSLFNTNLGLSSARLAGHTPGEHSFRRPRVRLSMRGTAIWE